MRSDQIKLGFERAPHRGLLRATGVDSRSPYFRTCAGYKKP